MARKHGEPRHFIRQWRKYRELTLEKLAERIGMTHQNLGKIERGQVAVTDQLLDILADHLNTDRASLLMRDPSKTDFRWSIWDDVQTMTPAQGAQVVEIIRALKKTGTNG